jgi:nucleoside-diphosphate-sugar epimerase
MAEMKTALVLGATGGIGGAMARALIARGWKVRALHRDPAKVSRAIAGVECVRGDAMQRADVVAAAAGATLIVHGVNPPGYRNWRTLALPMLENTVAAAAASGARICFPGTVYNFGPDAFPLVAEDAPQHPRTRKGAIRVEMEACLKSAAAHGVKSLILRAGDFFGPAVTANSWFSAALVKPGRRVRAVVYPGRHDVGHAWAYLPDVAETAMRLIERDAELPDFAVFHFDGHWFARGVEMAEMVAAAAGEQGLPIRRLPWWLVRLASPFVTTFREMLEMAYLWRRPVRLDNRRLLAFLGQEPHTPALAAVRASLQGLGCLGPVADAPAANAEGADAKGANAKGANAKGANARAANAQAAF